MKGLGITKGNAKVWDITDIYIGETFLANLRESDAPHGEDIANVKLITDTFNTTNKCGLLPSELLDRYNEAVEVLGEIVFELEDCAQPSDWESYDKLKQVINKHKEG